MGIEGIAYQLPAMSRTLEELQAEGLLTSTPSALRELGFESVRVADRPATELAEQVLSTVLAEAGVRAEQVGLLINATALPLNALVQDKAGAPLTHPQSMHLDTFKYSSTRLQERLGLLNARTLGMSELSCISLMGAVWMARALMLQDGTEYALCVNADVFAPGMKREVIYNLVSDSACAVLLKRDGARNRVRHFEQMTKGFYWNAELRQNELIAAYFPTSKRVVQNALKKLDLTMDDIDLIIPHNVSSRSWELLRRLLGVPAEKVFTDNIRSQAHSIAADNFINLKDALATGRVGPGSRVLMFCFGLGAHWGCSVVEV